MVRERKHIDAVARQAGYRKRKAERRKAARDYTDSRFAQAARDLYARLEYLASEGDAAAALVVGKASLETPGRAAQGYTDAELAQAVRDLHARLEYIASQGSAAAAAVVGKTALQTLRNLGKPGNCIPPLL